MESFLAILLFITAFSYSLCIFENTEVKLNLSHNEIKVEKDIDYILKLNLIEAADSDLLIYTNLDDVFNLTQFDLIKNENLTDEILFSASDSKSGFIDFLLVEKDKYIINKDIKRENFYKKNIPMYEGKTDYSYYINLIPTDNNSDLYFFQTNKSSVRDENKDRIKLYYLNDFSNKDLKNIFEYIKDHPMKRERCINGKAEIFGYYYDNLDKDIYIKISYNKIKGDGILGPILSLSILFVLLIIVVVIFIKNTYYDSGYRSKRSTISSKG